MAKEEIKFNKQVYGKVSYPKIINTGFGEVYTKVKLTKEQLTKAERKLENDKGEKHAHNI